ncbi:IPT/TIG domain-containing protein [Fulvivirga sp.]|uniref:IPT/TIG domain-containing protein n=1 Tax=Fulvivirga sp. TaxID=1931237 RepID=UPI0032EF799B
MELGNQDIIEYGFVWGETENLSIENSERKIIFPNPEHLSFDYRISTTLKEGIKYYVLSYIKTNKYLIYGQAVSFTSLGSLAPIITNFNPKYGSVGDTIAIFGVNFSYILKTNKIQFDQINAKAIYSSDSLIRVIVPDSIANVRSELSVQISGNKNVAAEPFEIFSPVINRIYPEQGKSGDTLTIDGEHFFSVPGQMEIQFGTKQASILEASNNNIKVIVPNQLNETDSVTVIVGPGRTSYKFNYLKPSILSLSPKLITWRDTVSVSVKNFYDDKTKQSLKINNLNVDLLYSSDSLIKFTIPDNLSSKVSNIQIDIAGFNLDASEMLTLRSPVITYSIDSVAFGEAALMKGKYFHPTNNRIDINGISINQTTTIESSEFNFQFTINPSDYSGENDVVNLNINVNNDVFSFSNPLVLRIPIVTDFYPKEISDFSQIVTIVGNNLENATEVLLKDAMTNYSTNQSDFLGDITFNLISTSKNKLTIKIGPANLINALFLEEFAQEIVGKIQVKIFNRNINTNEDFSFSRKTPWNLYSTGELFEAIQEFKSVSSDTEGFVIGVNTDSFYEYNPSINIWTTKQSWPQSNSFETIELAYYYNNKVYILTSEHKAYSFSNNSWTQINSDIVESFEEFIFANNQAFTLNGNEIFKFDPATAEILSQVTMPFPLSSVSSIYEFESLSRFQLFDNEEYIFDPNSMNFSFSRVVSNYYPIKYHNGNYFSYGPNEMFSFEFELYNYDPLTDEKELINLFPPIVNEDLIKFLFIVNDKMYFQVDAWTMISYDTTF